MRSFPTSNILLGLMEEIDISKISSASKLYSSQRRANMDGLRDSIKESGLLQPIIVRLVQDRFEIVAGHRRYEACKSLRWRKIICHVVELTDKEAFLVSLTENIQRSTLDVIEEATAFKEYICGFGWGGISDLAAKIGKSQSYVCKRLALLDLPPEMIEGMRNLSIKPSIAQELLPISDLTQRSKVAKIVVENRLSLRKTRQIVKDLRIETQAPSSKSDFSVYDWEDHNIDELFQIDKISEIDTNARRAFDKSITAIKIAMNKISSVIDGVEENWIVYEMLMQHKNSLHSQIDLLLKQKKKL